MAGAMKISDPAPYVGFNLTVQQMLLRRHLPLDKGATVCRPFRMRITKLLETAFVKMMTVAKPELTVEIGAHEAAFSVAVRKVLPEAKAVAFEAHPEVHAAHAERLAAAGIETHNLAVAEKAGKIEFAVPLMRDGTPNLQMGSLHQFELLPDATRFEVEAVRADKFLAGDAAKTNALWVDVEGAALGVLRSAEKLLPRTQLIFAEIETVERWKGQAVDTEIFDYLAGFGLLPLLRDVQIPNQYNCILARAELFEKPIVAQIAAEYMFKATRPVRMTKRTPAPA